MNFRRYFGVKLLSKKDTDKAIENASNSKVKSIFYKLGSQFLIDWDFPLHLYIELSRNCNYNCPMCMRKKAGSGGHFPENLLKKITSEAAIKGHTSYSLHLFGEPLANPYWYNCIKIIREAHPYNGILLTTNGFFMDKDASKKLIELNVDRIFVSLHSLDPKIYKRNTGGGDIKIVINNIYNFVKIAGKRKKTRLFIRLFKNPGDTQLDNDQLIQFKKLNIPVEIREYHNFAGGKPEWSVYKSGSIRWPCFHPWFTIGIGVDGRVTVCCADYKFGLEVGNISTQSIEEIWKSDYINSIRQEHLSNIYKKWKICEQCDTWQFHPNIFFNFQKKLKNNNIS